MSNELTRPAAMPVTSLQNMKDMAEEAAKSGLLGACTPAKAFVIVQHCASSGESLLDFKMKYHVTNDGQVTMRADRMLAEYKARGGKCVWKEINPDRAVALFSKDENQDLKVEYTIEEARAAGLVKPKSAWTTDPGAMCRARVITRGLRMVDPGCVAGVYEPSELPEEVTVDVLVSKEPVKVDVVVDVSEGVQTVDAAKPKTEVKSEGIDIGPSPFDKMEKQADVSNDFDYSVCPIKGKMHGKKWADMEVKFLKIALGLDSPDMEAEHIEAINAEIEKKENT